MTRAEYVSNYMGQPGVKDALGNVYGIGDRVVYGTTVGRSPVVRVAEVVKILPVVSRRQNGKMFIDEIPEPDRNSYQQLRVGNYLKGLEKARPWTVRWEAFTTAKVTVRPVATARDWSKITRSSTPTVDNILRFDSPVTEQPEETA
jgi:hypothetical protein